MLRHTPHAAIAAAPPALVVPLALLPQPRILAKTPSLSISLHVTNPFNSSRLFPGVHPVTLAYPVMAGPTLIVVLLGPDDFPPVAIGPFEPPATPDPSFPFPFAPPRPASSAKGVPDPPFNPPSPPPSLLLLTPRPARLPVLPPPVPAGGLGAGKTARL